jgi:hypothetical protein
MLALIVFGAKFVFGYIPGANWVPEARFALVLASVSFLYFLAL